MPGEYSCIGGEEAADTPSLSGTLLASSAFRVFDFVSVLDGVSKESCQSLFLVRSTFAPQEPPDFTVTV